MGGRPQTWPGDDPAQAPLPKAADFSPDRPYQEASWRRFASKRGWVEFGDFFGPDRDNSLSPLRGTCVACCTLESPADTQAALRIGWDEHIVVQVNDNAPVRPADHTHFQPVTLDVKLRKGKNLVAIALSTLPKAPDCFLSRTGSCFSFSCTTADGTILKPVAEESKTATCTRVSAWSKSSIPESQYLTGGLAKWPYGNGEPLAGYPGWS